MLSLRPKEGVVLYGNEVNVIITEPAKIKTALVCCWEISNRLNKRSLCERVALPPGFERLEPYMHLATSDDDAECLTIPEGAVVKEEPMGMRETILAYCNEHRLNLMEVAEQYGIKKDMTEDVLAGKLSMLKRDYGE
jgi:hypothetical protein